MTAPRGTSIVVTGTGTGIGKTVFAAGLAGMLGYRYWKPIQSGLAGETDRDTVARLSGQGATGTLAEAYRLTKPLSPHRAAEIDGVTIDVARLDPPASPLVIEGAGGLMVPVTRSLLQVDLFARWRLPVVLVAGTGLGTINHSLLSLDALGRRGVAVMGVAFVGDANDDNESTICVMGGVRRLGRLPRLEPLTAEALASAFRANFSVAEFTA